MSTVAKQIIGEADEQIRRIARMGVPQDKVRMLKLKQAFENSLIGYGPVAVRQTPIRNNLYVSILVIIDLWMANYHVPVQRETEEEANRRAVTAVRKAGYEQDLLSKPTVQFLPNGTARVEMDMKWTGKFDGYLNPDGVFKPANYRKFEDE